MIRLALWALGTLLLVLTILWFPVTFADQLTVPARVVPARQWLLLGGESSDGVTAILRNNVTGQADDVQLYTAIRGDNLHYRPHAGMMDGRRIAAGDTVGWLHSADLVRQVAELRADLDRARAELRLSDSDEKEAVVAVARRGLAVQRERTRRQQQQVAVQQALHSEDLISGEELAQAEHMLLVHKLQKRVAEAQLDVVTSGASAAARELIRTRIAGLEHRLALEQERQAAQTLVAPISGTTAGFYGPDTLLVVNPFDRWVAHLLIDVHDLALVQPEQCVRVSLPGHPGPIDGRITHISSRRFAVERRQVVLVVALLETDDELISSLFGRAQVILPGKPLRTLLWRGLRR